MLILTRHPMEVIRVGNDIKVTVVSIDRNQVRIGVTAPKEVAVHREEIYHRIREAEREQ